MISREQIEILAQKYQTTELNVLREYFQHLFLSYFYREPRSNMVYFKGGTALKILFGSPRFSEDLDFSAWQINIKDLEQMLVQTLGEIERENISVSLEEAKTTSGGYLANLVFKGAEFQPVVLQLEVSFRQDKLVGEIITVSGDFVPPYTVCALSLEWLVLEKIKALLERRKPRDFYDLYFILRSSLLPVSKRGVLKEVLEIVGDVEINFEKELKLFLPKTHWAVIKNFKTVLKTEIQRFL